MRIWQVQFRDNSTKIVFAEKRLDIWRKYPDVSKIELVVIH